MTRLNFLALIALVTVACTTTEKAPADSVVVSQPEAPPAVSPVDSAPPTDSVTMPPVTWVVNTRGINAITAGMTLSEANNVSGNNLIIPARLEECDHIRMKNGPDGVRFMVERGKISRIEIDNVSTVATSTGAKVGDSEDRIKSLYPGVAVQPHKYTDGHYLVVTPTSASDKDFRIVFETDGKKVLRYRAGLVPAVEYVESCS